MRVHRARCWHRWPPGSARVVDRGNRRRPLLAQGFQRCKGARRAGHPVLCGDGLTGLPHAVRSVYPLTDVQLCVVHQGRNATKFVSYKDRKPFCAAMRPIYTAPTIEAAELALDRFEQSWGARYPMSVASWRNHWDGLTAFFKYPVDFRRLIYTTNAIESLHSQMRKNIATRKVFPNDDAVIRILFLNIRNFSNRWSRRQGWDIVMNQLAVLFGDRLKPEVGDAL